MPRYSPHLRWRIVSLACRNYTAEQISDILLVDPRTVQRIVKLWLETNDVIDKDQLRPRGLPEWAPYLQAILVENPLRYLDEMRRLLMQRYGVPKMSLSSIWRTMNALGWTHKRVSVLATQASAQAAARYIMEVSSIHPSRMAFLDETGFTEVCSSLSLHCHMRVGASAA